MKTIIPQIIRQHLYDNEDAPAKAFRRFVNRIDNDYYDHIRRDTDHLSPEDELKPSLRQKVMDDFEKLVAHRLDANFELAVMADINQAVAKTSDQEEINSAISTLKSNADLLRSLIPEKHKYTEEEINRLYENALRITPLEWLQSSNKKDVIMLHHALQDDTVEKVQDRMDEAFADFMERIAQRMESLLLQ